MTILDGEAPNQIVPDPTSPVVTNPAKPAFNITVSVPEQITVKMVDASSLADYEMNIFVSSLAFGFFTAFLVPAIQESRADSQLATPFIAMTVLIGAILLAFLGMALNKRKRLNKTGREIKLETIGATLQP